MRDNYDVLIMITPKDFCRLQCCYEHLAVNMPGEKLYFVGNTEVGQLVEESGLGEKVGFINEESILPFDTVNEVMKQALDIEEVPRGITGWYYQQFLKMSYAAQCEKEYYLMWDGDTIPCKPFGMFSPKTGKPYLDLKTEYHEEYFVTLGRLLPGMHKCIRKSFIAEHMLMNCRIMCELIAAIESNDGVKGNAYYEKVLWAIDRDKLQENSFSEFETYGTFVAYRYPGQYHLRDWHSFRYGGAFFDPHTISDEDYEWLGRDFFAISFEKGDSVREDHKNLFDNKEYQRKLSARQMLTIAQQEFHDGYMELWDQDQAQLVDKNEPEREEKKKILYVGTEEISLPDLVTAFGDMGCLVDTFHCRMHTAGYVPEEEERICGELKRTSYQYVISHNFCETIARACYRYRVPYIAWVFDMPQKELYTSAAFYHNNYIFVFDRCQQKRLKEIGIPHVYATPLGVLPRMWEQPDEEMPRMEISFVGQLYGNPYLEQVLREAPGEVGKEIDLMIKELFLRWEEQTPSTGYLSKEAVSYLRRVKGEDITVQYPYMTEQYYYEAAVISRILANRERVTALNALAERHEAALYTFDSHLEGLDAKVKVFPGVGFGGQAGRIYRQSKINLNLSLHCIESGACQRIFDIMAAGGFVLSNYQRELEELFVPGEEIVLFHNREELMELAEYYLSHPAERERIARNGQRKVKECYSYSVLLKKALDCVDADRNREKTLPDLITECKELIYGIRRQDYQGILPGLKEVLTRLFDRQDHPWSGESSLIPVLEQLLQAQKAEDMILAADLLEEGLLPALSGYLKIPETVKVGKYLLEGTSSGYLTVKDLDVGRYLHSNCDPMEEARIWVSECYDPFIRQYAVWGCGLGYHVRALYRLSGGNVKITVFEQEEALLELAKSRGDLEELAKDALRLVHDPDGSRMQEFLSTQQAGLLVHLPSLQKVQEPGLREQLSQFFRQQPPACPNAELRRGIVFGRKESYTVDKNI